MYQKDVTQALVPSAPSGRGQALESQSRGMLAEAVLGGVQQGVSIFEDVQKGKFATKQAGLVEEFETAGQVVKAKGTAAKDLTFLDEGPPAEAAVAAFQERQKAFLHAAEQFPNKFKEMKQRSMTLLKEYVAKYPGLADEFRKTSAELTGIGRLDLENIRELYNDVEWMQKKQQDEAAASAKQLDEFRKVAVETMVQDGRMDRLTAMRAVQTMTVADMVAYTSRFTAARNAKLDFEQGLKRGDFTVGNIIANTKAEWPGAEAALTGPAYLLMKSKGITPGAFTQEQLADPEIKRMLTETFSTRKTMLKEFYLTRLGELRAQVGGANSDAAKQAITELNAWYAAEDKKWDEKSFYMNPLNFGQTGVDVDTMSKRLELVNKFWTTLGIPADNPARQVLMNFDQNSEIYKTTLKNNPHLGPVLPYIREMVQKSSYATSAEWEAFTASMTKAMFVQPTLPAAPKTREERAAVQAATEAFRFKIGELVRGTLKPEDNPADVVNGYLQNVLLTGNGAATAARELALAKQAIEKLPEQQRAASVQLFSQKVNQSIYGVNSDADIAKQRAMPSIQANAELSFLDPRGLTPLRLQATSVVPTMIGDAPQASIGEVAPDVLTAIDNKLRLEADLTGKPLPELRQNFMKVFNAEGVPSSTVVRQLSGPSARPSGVSLGNPNLEGTGSTKVSPELQARRDQVAGQEARMQLTPAERLDYIAKLEKALKEEMSPETKAFLSRELKMMRGD